MSSTESKDGRVTVNIHQNDRIYQIIATLLLCGSIGMISYALAENGWIEIAATMLTMFLVQLTTLLFRNGIIGLPEKNAKGASFTETKGMLRTAAEEFRQWQARSPIWRLTALATVYTLTFMILRAGMGWALQIFTNIWVAGAVAALLASLIIFPSLITSALRGVGEKVTASKEPAGDTEQVETNTPDTKEH